MSSADPSPRLTAVSAVVSLVKEILLTAAIAIGGAWALFRYDFLESNAAKVQYELELARSKAQVVLSTRIEESVAKMPDRFLVFGRYFIKNEGTRDTVVASGDNDAPPVTIYRLDTSKAAPVPIKATLVSAFFYDEQGDILTEISIDAGRETSAPFAVSVKEPGLYLLNLSVPVRNDDLGPLEKPLGDDWTWSEQKVLLIQ